VNLTRNQKEWIVIGVVAVPVFIAIVFIAANHKYGWFDKKLENCVKNNYEIPPIELYIYSITEEYPDIAWDQAADFEYILDENSRISFRVFFSNGNTSSFAITEICADEEGLLYPIIEYTR
jgi:hypothetical protein